jgi:4-hydroxybenzoate polyprenyltransferase
MSALATYSRMIKLSHSVFALPFALAAALLASREVSTTWTQWALIVACMVTARSSAMGFNRLVDARYDALNPRTASRELPSGAISSRAAWAFTLGSAALFVLLSGLLGEDTLALSPVALAVVWGYSLTKRFTWLCHLWLGGALGLAPVAVWIALTGTVAPAALLLAAAVATWVAGFDLIYACQDVDFDRSIGLQSAPARLGVTAALALSAVLHVGTVGCLVALPGLVTLGPAYGVGVLGIGAVLVYEHTLVSPSDLSRVDKAFFDLNGYVSLLFLASVALAV